jgi:hypothetical protein
MLEIMGDPIKGIEPNPYYYQTFKNRINEEDPIFTRFGTGNGTDSTYGRAFNSFMISSAPIEGLFFGLMVNGNMFGTLAAEAYRFMQIGLGYDIGGIGHARAQFIGGDMGSYSDQQRADNYEKKDAKEPTEEKPARIEAAFALTAVENLLVDIGLKLWMPVTFTGIETKFYKGIDASVGATYRMGAFGLGARFEVAQMASYSMGRPTTGDADTRKEFDPFVMDIRLVPSYDLDSVTIGADIGFGIAAGGKLANGDSDENSVVGFGFGAFVRKNLGPGHVMLGLSYTAAPIVKDPDKSGATGSGVFQIPIVLEYYF